MAHARRSIEEKIASGQYYDAQQVVKTLHRRLCTKGQQSEAAQLCVDSARRFIDAKEYELAVDLGKDLVAALEASKAAPSEENLAQIEAVFESIPPGAAVTQKYAFLHQALKWSTATCSDGDPRLHRLGGMAYWAEKEFGKCQGHLVYCGDGPCLAQMVREWRQQGYPNERDLFALRTLLILLSLNDLTTARTFWDMLNEMPLACERRHGSASMPSSSVEVQRTTEQPTSVIPPGSVPSVDLPAAPESTAQAAATTAEQSIPSAVASTAAAATPAAVADAPQVAAPEAPAPVVCCGTFLLAAAEAKSIDFFRMVRAKYALVIRRDPTFDKYLDEIEVRTFGAQVQRSGLGAMFDALMGGLGNGPVAGQVAAVPLS